MDTCEITQIFRNTHSNLKIRKIDQSKTACVISPCVLGSEPCAYAVCPLRAWQLRA